MKKIFTLVVVMFAAALVSCGGNTGKAAAVAEEEVVVETTCCEATDCATCEKADSCEMATEVAAEEVIVK